MTRRIELRVVPLILVMLILAAAGLTALLYFGWYQTDRQTDKDARQSAATAASEGIVAILTYTPDTVDADVINAKSHLTGEFLSYYDDFTQKIVAPAAKQKSVTTTAQIVGSAVQELHPDSAVVLVFVNQTTMSKDRPEPGIATSSVLVTMTKVGDKWLISKFDPV